MPDDTAHPGADIYFALFTEIGIVAQLSGAMFQARLPDGILVSQFSILNHLIRVKDGRTPLELARAFQVPKTTMTHSLSVLHRHALVETRANPADKRSKCIWITDAGRAFRAEMIAALRGDMQGLIAAYPPDKVQGLLPLVAELRVILDKMRDTDPTSS